MQYEGRSNQTLIDVAIQTCGSVEAVYALAVTNGIDVTADVQGVALTYGKSDILEQDTVSMLSIDSIVVAGKVLPEQVEKGIGYWRIGQLRIA